MTALNIQLYCQAYVKAGKYLGLGLGFVRLRDYWIFNNLTIMPVKT